MSFLGLRWGNLEGERGQALGRVGGKDRRYPAGARAPCDVSAGVSVGRPPGQISRGAPGWHFEAAGIPTPCDIMDDTGSTEPDRHGRFLAPYSLIFHKSTVRCVHLSTGVRPEPNEGRYLGTRPAASTPFVPPIHRPLKVITGPPNVHSAKNTSGKEAATEPRQLAQRPTP